MKRKGKRWGCRLVIMKKGKEKRKENRWDRLLVGVMEWKKRGK